MTGTRRIMIATVILAAVSAVFGVIMLTSRPMSSAMPGMDMSGSTAMPTTTDHGEMAGMDMSGSAPTPTPTPTMDPDMPGMDMSGSTATPTPTMDPDMPGMDMPEAEHGAGGTAVAAADRPIGPVLGTFGGGSAAVLLTAGIMRRRDRAATMAKQAARASRRAQK